MFKTKTKTITLDFKCENRPSTKADFTYKISPDAIEIVDTRSRSAARFVSPKHC